ncbi:testis-expressed sequence 2 protein-like protein, partial [Euroglyphus maynei]
DNNNLLQSPSPTPITSKLVIFARTCREKEEWFWAIKTSIDSIINNQKNSISVRGSNNSLNDSPSESKTYLFVSATGELKQTDSETIVTQQTNHHHQQQQCLHILTRRLNYYNFMRTNILNAEGIGPGNPGMMTALTWFNVLLNRLSFDILNKPNWSAYIAKKLQRKLRRLRLPYFMESLTITEIDIGTTLPKFNSVPSVPNVDDAGLWIEFDVNYSGLL